MKSNRVSRRGRGVIRATGALLGLLLRLRLADVAALVEDDPPLAVRFEAPNGVEPADQLSRRIVHRAAAQRERTRVEHLDGLGLPRKGRRRTVEELLPRRGHFVPTAVELAAEEESLLRHELPE